ncbi:MAG: ROK family protein [Vulcanimicrobiota bacterium]
MKLYGGIEAGGTKIVCTVAGGPASIMDEIRFPTTTPEETIERCIGFFKKHHEKNNLSGLGIGSFGPVDPEPNSPTYGYVTSTPKPGWKNCNFMGAIKEIINIPMAFDTDVNAAALAEHKWGSAQDVDQFIYLTIGTGIGGGAFSKGRLVHGLVHPEMGHIFIPHDREKDPYNGFCPYHGDCLEGLAAGPALEGRWKEKAENFDRNHPAWDLEAHYLALALVNFACTFSPKRFILGGGVMNQVHLFPLIRAKFLKYLNGYIQSPFILDNIDTFIVPPGLGNRAGMLGAIALAQRAEEELICK